MVDKFHPGSELPGSDNIIVISDFFARFENNEACKQMHKEKESYCLID